MKNKILWRVKSSFVFEFLLRGVALFLGLYTLGSLVLSQFGPVSYDANIWWIDLRVLPSSVAAALSIIFGFALLHRGVLPTTSKRASRIRLGVFGVMAAVLIVNSCAVLLLHWQNGAPAEQEISGVSMGMPIPLSLLLAIGVLWMMRKPTTRRSRSVSMRFASISALMTTTVGTALLAALALMLTFGESDYRRPADAIVVYGCKAYPDGVPSQALADRVHTACELYHQRLAPVIVMSGGPVDEQMHETQAMADYAVSLGVPRSAIRLDPHGLDTQATANNLTEVLDQSRSTRPIRVLAVSHDYHLPRVKLSLQRQGVVAYTVPCEIRRGLPSKPYLVARETVAWWYYYLNPLLAIKG